MWGNTASFSVNYERLYQLKKESHLITSRIGLSYLPIFGSNIFSFPISSSFLMGSGDGRLELGLGSSYILGTEGNDQYNLINSLIVGYRLQPVNKRILVRMTMYPSINTLLNSSTSEYIIRAGFSFGYVF